MNNELKQDGPDEGLRVIAIFEAAKGLLVLLAGCGLLSYIHQDLHAAAEHLVRHFHLNPASHYPRIFIDLADQVTNRELWYLALSAALYAAIRFVEAFGLWMQRSWAEWFALLSGGMYVPIEIIEVYRRITWPRVTLLTVNTGIVIYLAFLLYQARQDRT